MNRLQGVNSFSEGMNKDVHPLLVTNKQYKEAWNATLMSSKGDLFSINNERGFLRLEDFYTKTSAFSSGLGVGDHHLIVGLFPIEDGLVVFSISTDGDSVTALSSEIGKLDRDGIYTRVVNDHDPIVNPSVSGPNPEYFNFDIRYQIDAQYKVDFKGNTNVYFTDGLNPPRVVDVDFDYTSTPYVNLSQQSNLFNLFNSAIVRYTGFSFGGSIKPGIYHIVTRYLNNTFDPSDFGLISNGIPVTPELDKNNESSYGGADFQHENVGKSLNLRIDNIDQDFTYIEVYVIYYTGPANTPKANRIHRSRITDTTMNIIWDGRIEEEVSLVEIITKKINYITAKHIKQKDGRLFLSNLKGGSTVNLQPIANRLRVKWDITTKVEHTWRNKPEFQDYSEEELTFGGKGWARNEIYSLAIVGHLIQGGETEAFHIPAYLDVGDVTYFNIGNLLNVAVPNVTPDSTNEGITKNPASNYLGTYLSTEVYDDPSGEFYTDNLGNPLHGTPIRHHVTPDHKQEPIIASGISETQDAGTPANDLNHTVDIRILHLIIEGLDTALAAYPALAGQLQGISLVRQKRDTEGKRRVWTLGIGNQIDNWNGYIPLDINDHSVDNEPSLQINPFFGDTRVQHACGVFGTEIGAGFYMGQQVRPDGTGGGNGGSSTVDIVNHTDLKKLGFFSPETIFTDGFRIPSGAKIRPIMQVSALMRPNYATGTFLLIDAGGVLPVFGGWTNPYGNVYAADPIGPSANGGFARCYIASVAEQLGVGSSRGGESFGAATGAAPGEGWKPENRTSYICQVFANFYRDIKSDPSDFYFWDSNTKVNIETNLGSPIAPARVNENFIIPNNGCQEARGNPTTAQLRHIEDKPINNSGNEEYLFLNLLDDLVVPYCREPWRGGSGTDPGSVIYINKTGGYRADAIGAARTDITFLYNPIPRFIYQVYNYIPSQYGALDGNEYVLVDTFYKDDTFYGTDQLNVALTRPIFNGDVFISQFFVDISTYHLYYLNNEIGAEDLDSTGLYPCGGPVSPDIPGDSNRGGRARSGNVVYLESEINCNYRHRPVQRDPVSNVVTRQGVPYWPYDSVEDVLKPVADLGHSNGYNILYSNQNDLRKYFIRPFNFINITKYPNRTIYSDRSFEGEISDKYRVFLPNSYQDTAKHKGEIANTFVFNGDFYIHVDRTLFKAFVNTAAMISTTADEQVLLGNTGVFSREPVEVFALSGGYAGTQHKWANVDTPFGYIFTDFTQKKVFILSGEGLIEVSQKGLRAWFIENMNFVSADISGNENYYNNPANPFAVGMVATYDPDYKRYILTIQKSLVESPISIKMKESDTISLNLINQFWTSFHSYSLAVVCNDDNHVFSFPNLLKFGLSFTNDLFKHNKDAFGVFYNRDAPEEFIVVFYANMQYNFSKVFDNFDVLAEFINEQTGVVLYEEFFNYLQVNNDYQNSGVIPLIMVDAVNFYNENYKRYNNQYQVTVPLSSTVDSQADLYNPANIDQTQENKPRIRSKYAEVMFRYLNLSNYRLVLNQIITKFRAANR